MTVAADDGTDIARITVTISVTAAAPNNAPVFSAATATRSVPDSTAPGGNVGDPVTATDPDNDNLTYTLGGTDAGSFAIDSGTGQITVGTGTTLNARTKDTYTVVVTATDPSGEIDTITVTITVIDVAPNRAPVFPASETGARSVPDSTAPGGNVGAPVAATDPDNDTLTYTLGGTDAGSFRIGSGTGQITVGTGTTLNARTKDTYTVVITATDPSGESDTITVTITVTLDLLDEYDLNDNGVIDRDEALAAITDYLLHGRITKEEARAVIRLYLTT